MTTFHRTTALALLPSLVLVALLSTATVASQPKALLVAPQDDFYVPKFGFSSFNIAGYGERVTHVRWGGLAAQLGLEPGDTILSMNGFRLSYHGSWNDALYRAMSNGGVVRLRIRDVRTGFVVARQMYLGDGIGPVTPHYAGGIGPNVQHVIHHDHHHHNHNGLIGPIGPVTPKSKFGPNKNQNLNKTIKNIAKLFND